MFLVEQSAVEEVISFAAEAECSGDLFDLVDKPFWCCVGSESFSVAVPEFDVSWSAWEDFDECVAVVVFELWFPAHFEEDFCFGGWYAGFGSRGKDILSWFDCEFHGYFRY